jgi:RNA recognition motif-containing protein
MDIYVGNMSYTTTAETLRALFEQYGTVTSSKIVLDRETGRPRGFGFIEMPNDDEGRAAIAAIDGKEFESRTLKVNQAQPKQARGPMGGGGGGGGGGGSRPPRRNNSW